MGQSQYDILAHAEQQRRTQYMADLAHERSLDDALDGAHIATAEMDGNDILDMIANDPALDARLVILIERVAMLGVAGTAAGAYEADVLRAAHDMQAALVGVVADRRYKAVQR